jgi:DNA-binding response OmpR family regulator
MDIVTALFVSPAEEDHIALKGIFETSNWRLHKADRAASVIPLLYKHGVGVVLCERDLGATSWRDVLEELNLLPDAPPLIVTSRLADDNLWAEALNLGAYDVLAKPFARLELIRTVRLAWLHWHHRHDHRLARSGKKVMTAGNA